MAKRPPRRPAVTIADCRSVTLYDNPAPNCPHGKAWRESTISLLTPEQRALRCDEPGCAAVEYHPHEGESVTFRPMGRAIGERRPYTLVGDALNENASVSQTARLMQPILEKGILAWTWTGAPDVEEGTEPVPLKLPREDWDAVADRLEFSELLWLCNAIVGGEDPAETVAAEGNA